MSTEHTFSFLANVPFLSTGMDMSCILNELHYKHSPGKSTRRTPTGRLDSLCLVSCSTLNGLKIEMLNVAVHISFTTTAKKTLFVGGSDNTKSGFNPITSHLRMNSLESESNVCGKMCLNEANQVCEERVCTYSSLKMLCLKIGLEFCCLCRQPSFRGVFTQKWN